MAGLKYSNGLLSGGRTPVGTAQDFEDRVDLPFEVDVHAIERRMMDFRRLSRFDVDDAEFFGNPDSGVVAGVDRSAEGVGDADQPGEIDSSLQHSGEVAIGFGPARNRRNGRRNRALRTSCREARRRSGLRSGARGSRRWAARKPARRCCGGRIETDDAARLPANVSLTPTDSSLVSPRWRFMMTSGTREAIFLEFPQCGGVPRIRAGEHGDSGHVLLLERQAGRNAFAVIVRVDENPGRQVFLPHGCEMPFHQSQVRRVPARDREEEGGRNFRIQAPDFLSDERSAARYDAQQAGRAEFHDGASTMSWLTLKRF